MRNKYQERKTFFTTYEKVIGAVMLLLFLLIVLMLSFFLWRKGEIRKPFILYTEVDSAIGFGEKMPVKINGIDSGYVDKFYINKKGKIELRMLLDRTYSSFIRDDSEATLMDSSIMGKKIVNISIGSPKSIVIQEHYFIKSKVDKGLSGITEMLNPAISELTGTSLMISKIANDLSTTTLQIQRLLNSTQQIVDSVNKKEGTIGMLLKDTKLYERADTILKNFEDIQSGVTSITTKSNQTIDDVRVSISKLNTLIDKSTQTAKSSEKTVTDLSNLITGDITMLINSANKVLGSLFTLSHSLEKTSERLPDFLQKAKDEMNSIETLVEAFKRHWLIRKYLPKEKWVTEIIQYEER